MLNIRKTQIEAMTLKTKRNAASDISQRLLEQSPFFQYFTELQREEWVLKQIDYLAQLNVHEKKSVEGIIEVIAQHGERFERCPDPDWALSILENTNENESIRAIMLQRANVAYLKEIISTVEIIKDSVVVN